MGKSRVQGWRLLSSTQGENDNDQINVSTVPGGANNQNGSFIYTDPRTGLGGTTGVGLANLAIGLADSYTEIGPKSYTPWRGQMYELFVRMHGRSMQSCISIMVSA